MATLQVEKTIEHEDFGKATRFRGQVALAVCGTREIPCVADGEGLGRKWPIQKRHRVLQYQRDQENPRVSPFGLADPVSQGNSCASLF